MGGVFIQRKRKDGKDEVVAIPREAVLVVELRGEEVLVTTTRSTPNVDLKVRLKPEQVENVKAQLLSFAEGKVLWIVEKE
jgi:hypothetical protein